MRNYSDKKYIKATETNPDPILKKHMNQEYKILSEVENSKNKTFIDLGAGHGRLTPLLAKISKNTLSIEINEDMIPELKRRSSKFKNTKVIMGDMTKLSKVLINEKLSNPVLLLVQNTLGTIEGNDKKVLQEMKRVAKENNGEIIISLFRQEALKTWGTKLYSHISYMVGDIDVKKTNFSKGLFVSKTGYTSKWRNKKEIENIIEYFNGKIINQKWTQNWCVIHIKF